MLDSINFLGKFQVVFKLVIDQTYLTFIKFIKNILTSTTLNKCTVKIYFITYEV
jgi:hypothetical protein